MFSRQIFSLDIHAYPALTKPVPSSGTILINFPVGQVAFSSHLPHGQEPRQAVHQVFDDFETKNFLPHGKCLL